MPAAATAGATRATYGVPVPRVARIPATSTTAVATIHPTSSDGAVTSARARPGERSTRPASRPTHPRGETRRPGPTPGDPPPPPPPPPHPPRRAPPHLRSDPKPHPAQVNI